MPPIIKVSDQNELVLTKQYPYANFPFEKFNPVQSRVIELYDKDINIIVAAPTSCGKTVIAEMFMAHEIRKNNKKTMYLSPMRSLTQEKYDDWTRKIHHFSDLKTCICTGDYRLTASRRSELDQADIILFTSEMLNSQVRNYKDSDDYIKNIGTLVVDECFPGRTLVAVDNRREVPIKKIVEDDRINYVMSCDPDSHKIIKKKILRKIIRNLTSKLIKVKHKFGCFICTEEHKVWTENGYSPACQLANCKIKLFSDKLSEVREIVSYEDETKVYDLEVEDFHNYFAEGVLVSNCHLLTVDGRGDHLEAGLMKFTEINPKCRLVLLSATMPNVSEISDWVSYVLTGRQTYLLSSEYRPCPLNVHYEKYFESEISYENNELQKIDMAMQIVEYYPQDKFLIFAHTKRTGELMKKALLNAGITCEYHNADLTKDKRIVLENNFKEDPDLRVVVATSTLAWGCYAKGTLVSMANGTTKRIEEINPGDSVIAWSSDGFVSRFARRVGEKTVDESLEFYLATGDRAIVSKDHIFYTWSGEIRADKLIVNDYIRVYNKCCNFSRILRIEESIATKMWDIEVEDLHNFVGNGIVSHNCNLPARRVIVLGIHRGLDEVASYDVIQEVGRAGRPAFDPVGDAYILLPEKQFDMYKAKLKKPQPIQSQMLDCVGNRHKNLAFHLVSEINNGCIKDKHDVYHWYKRTLASFQSHEMDDKIANDTLDLLKRCGAVWEENGIYTTTSIGKIASLFYFSPFDVSDLKRNFTELFDNNRENNDYHLSYALGNVDKMRSGIVSTVERGEMSLYANDIEMYYPKAWQPAVKAGYAYYLLLNGRSSQYFVSLCRNLQVDFPRICQVLMALDGFTGKWNKRSWFKELQVRISCGVGSRLVKLCAVDNVGKVRAEKLYKSGIKTPEDIVKNTNNLAQILGVSDKVAKTIIESAKNQ